ncbi:MAG: RusA family crossover junction endodeoxyribonuclease [Peptococcaceae bacterium]|nr:RusA family crossover junction endodeoxyribonuclease [Peptococcaceae bacterium]
MIRLEIAGIPVAQGRPRASVVAGHAHVYDPANARDYKRQVRYAAQQQLGDQKPLQGPLRLSVEFYRDIPRSWSRKRQLQANSGLLRPTSKPDLDNYVKAVKDALNGVCWLDDSQVVEYGPTGKFYSDKPRIVVTVEQVSQGAPSENSIFTEEENP